MRGNFVDINPLYPFDTPLRLKAKFHYASWFGADSKLVRTR